ncbi:MAG: hypothetical protein RIS41_1789 [Actinomycetota bacterium]|jgi:hypothetical protein
MGYRGASVVVVVDVDVVVEVEVDELVLDAGTFVVDVGALVVAGADGVAVPLPGDDPVADEGLEVVGTEVVVVACSVVVVFNGASVGDVPELLLGT